MTSERDKFVPPPINKQPIGGNGNGGGWWKPIISVIASVIISVVLVTMGVTGAITQDKFDTQIKSALAAIAQAQTELSGVKTAVDNAVVGIDGKISSQVNSAILTSLAQINSNISTIDTKVNNVQNQVQEALNRGNVNAQDIITINSELDSINNDITAIQQLVVTVNTDIENLKTDTTAIKQSVANINTTLTNLRNDITAIQQVQATLIAGLAALTTRVTALETPTTTTSTSGISIDIKQLSDTLIPATNDKSISTQLKLTLTNTLSVKVDDIVINLLFQTELIPTSTNPTVELVSSPALNWFSNGFYSFQVIFRNSWGLSIDAGKTKIIYVTFTISDTSPIFSSPYGYGYEVVAEIE